ncbi:hypothetical protein KTQ42_20280 [Noviherbaspirillum sp. L7-7A]|uniref:hypothetical protein n=1 Tax=Noviherbaspirillum sp. L7-7A TaxID=2850560 RepID=UPI001C2C749F|nr:hypothetical protein [Noviherbaspirillum sp. L7-7A]MBV0881622.1 hypothetical protein [Noviherbaspirillum sp. L7-7A]
MHAEKLFEKMKAIIERAGYPLLSSYKVDFYVHDREYLRQNDAPGVKFMWIVRESGTYLCRLSVAPRVNAEVDYAIDIHDANRREVYLLDRDAGTVKLLDDTAAKRRLKEFDYKVGRCTISRKGERIAVADIRLTSWTNGKPPTGTVHCHTGQMQFPLETLYALRSLAVYFVIEATHSLFTATEKIFIEGTDINELIAAHPQPVIYPEVLARGALHQGSLELLAA